VFPIYDVSTWLADRPETLGSKEKTWLNPDRQLDLPARRHLFKVGRPNTGENWIFVGYLLFDALIGNTDRHHDNWGHSSHS
jgi:hypothetical protein